MLEMKSIRHNPHNHTKWWFLSCGSFFHFFWRIRSKPPNLKPNIVIDEIEHGQPSHHIPYHVPGNLQCSTPSYDLIDGHCRLSNLSQQRQGGISPHGVASRGYAVAIEDHEVAHCRYRACSRQVTRPPRSRMRR